MSDNALRVYTIAHDALLGGAITRKPFAKTIASARLISVSLYKLWYKSAVLWFLKCMGLYHSPAYGVLLGLPPGKYMMAFGCYQSYYM